jgi:hypothetical protein
MGAPNSVELGTTFFVDYAVRGDARPDEGTYAASAGEVWCRWFKALLTDAHAEETFETISTMPRAWPRTKEKRLDQLRQVLHECENIFERFPTRKMGKPSIAALRAQPNRLRRAQTSRFGI